MKILAVLGFGLFGLMLAPAAVMADVGSRIRMPA